MKVSIFSLPNTIIFTQTVVVAKSSKHLGLIGTMVFFLIACTSRIEASGSWSFRLELLDVGEDVLFASCNRVAIVGADMRGEFSISL